ncbi:MAG TPA: peptide-methionine (S)-S-oxide reductase MsrA [Alphaproteobacteria bacterium]|nr:peptide-methionine (S)-S-oxide reductase MsrA [Alphaproteobacteria bacterium]
MSMFAKFIRHGVLGLAILVAPAAGFAAALPNPTTDAPLAASHGSEKAVLAGGCFWGVQAVFQHVKGVTNVTSGYSGGAADTAHYEIVSGGATGHAESVEVTYDPAQISYGQLLKVYFAIAHDPTQLNYQGPDEGTQYRSSIFYSSPEQQKIANDYIAQLTAAKAFPEAIVTKVVPLKAFYPAEAYHQNFATLHPNHPYIAHWDLPKVANLQKELPDLYVTPVTN